MYSKIITVILLLMCALEIKRDYDFKDVLDWCRSQKLAEDRWKASEIRH